MSKPNVIKLPTDPSRILLVLTHALAGYLLYLGSVNQWGGWPSIGVYSVLLAGMLVDAVSAFRMPKDMSFPKTADTECMTVGDEIEFHLPVKDFAVNRCIYEGLVFLGLWFVGVTCPMLDALQLPNLWSYVTYLATINVLSIIFYGHVYVCRYKIA